MRLCASLRRFWSGRLAIDYVAKPQAAGNPVRGSGCWRDAIDRVVDGVLDRDAVGGFQVELDFHLHDRVEGGDYQGDGFGV